MKAWGKILLRASLILVATTTAVFSAAYADTSSDPTASFFGSTSRGFKPSDIIIVTGLTTTGVLIEAPVIQANSENILEYTVVYAEGKSINDAQPQELIEQTFNLDASAITNNQIQLQLTGLTPGTGYDFVIKPINKDGVVGDLSTDYTFTTPGISAPAATVSAAPSTGTAAMTTGADTGAMLGAAQNADANFSYTASGGTITLTWQDTNTAASYQFALKNITDADYKTLGSAKASDQSFSFVVGTKGSYNVKIDGFDSAANPIGVEKVLNVKVDMTAPTPGKGTPKTGEDLNIILMSTFLLMLIYVVYKFRGAR